MGQTASALDCTANPLHSVNDETVEEQVIDDRAPARDSIIWKWQREFYDKSGLRPWADAVVPHFATSNSFVARALAKTILSFLQDVCEQCDDAIDSEPVYILELGAGHGKLAYLVVECLLRLAPFLPRAAGDRVCFKYVATDASPSCVEAMRSHPRLQDFFEKGLLDVAQYDAEAGGSVKLLHSGVELSPGRLRRPIFAISGYVFNTLRQDVFRVHHGTLEQGYLSVAGPCGDAGSEKLTNMTMQWTYGRVSRAGAVPRAPTGQASAEAPAQPWTDPYSEDPVLADVLRQYAASQYLAPGATVPVPLGGVAAIRHLHTLSSGRMVLLCVDKGVTSLSELRGIRDPHIALHGSFSFNVNFHALRQYTKARGGYAMTTAYADGLKCAAFCFGGTVGGVASSATSSDALVGVQPCSSTQVLQSRKGMFQPSQFRLGDPLIWLEGLVGSASGVALPARAGAPLPWYPLSAFSSAPNKPGDTGSGFAPDDDELEDFADRSGRAYPEMRQALREGLLEFTADDFGTLQRGVREACSKPSLRLALSLLRLSNHDMDVFLKFKAVFVDKSAHLAGLEAVMQDLRTDVDRVYAAYYPLQPNKDVCFELGRTLMSLASPGSSNLYMEAAQFFLASREHVGVHPMTAFNLGICLYFAGNFAGAADALEECLRLQPGYADAQAWLDRVRAITGTTGSRTPALETAAEAAATSGATEAPSREEEELTSEPPDATASGADAQEQQVDRAVTI